MNRRIFKVLIYIAMCFAVVASAYASGASEDQRQFLESIPGLLQDKGPTGITTTSSQNTIKSMGSSQDLAAATYGNAIIDRDMTNLTRLYKYLEQNYLWDIDYTQVYQAMAKAMFDTLGDKYTYYVKPDDTQEFKENFSGKYGGLGFLFSKVNPENQDPSDEETLYCNINQVYPNTPAAWAGMLAGDYITHVNGESIVDKTATECSNIMRGDVGKPVTVTIKRHETSFDLTMVREIISIPDTVWEMIDSTTGYLEILQFYPTTCTQVKNALSEMKKQGMEKLIIDLRNNPGGDVEACLSIADLFISDKLLITFNYKDENKIQKRYASSDVFVDPSVKIAILINGDSASSSEILASTMKDNGRAILVGQKSFGKGIMQASSPWGASEISVTVASFIPPSGNEIHKVGVMPDVELQGSTMNDEEVLTYKEIMEKDTIKKYVDKNPEYTKENVERFVRQHQEIKLRPEIVKLMVRNEYMSRMSYDERPKVDTWFDPELTRAIEELNK